VQQAHLVPAHHRKPCSPFPGTALCVGEAAPGGRLLLLHFASRLGHVPNCTLHRLSLVRFAYAPPGTALCVGGEKNKTLNPPFAWVENRKNLHLLGTALYAGGWGKKQYSPPRPVIPAKAVSQPPNPSLARMRDRKAKNPSFPRKRESRIKMGCYSY
jgi:hypothetical protein